MRSKIMLSVLCASAWSGASACKWTEFDDLQDETWVGSTEKPNVKSSDYGIAIQRGDDGTDSASSGTLAVIGASDNTYSELLYDSNGGSKLQNNALVLRDQGIMTLDPSPPLLLASPASAEVALVTAGDNGSIVVATGAHTLLVRQLFVGLTNTSVGSAFTISTTPDAATYMQPIKHPDIADLPKPEPLVGAGDVVLGTVYGLPPTSKQPACKLADGTNAIQIRALGTVRLTTGPNAGTDDILMWNGADGKLHRFAGSAFNGCVTATPTTPSLASVATGFTPGKGSQILTIDANRVLLQGHQDVTKGNTSFLQVFDSATLAPLGNPVMIDGLRTAAVIRPGVTTGPIYVLAGFPTASVDGKTGAGEVQVFKLADTAGLDPTTAVARLHDAQPDGNQQFGRSVAALPYNGKQVMAVAADNEIFVYYRANQTDGTPLYDETRQGR
jgi:hypothetical protein